MQQHEMRTGKPVREFTMVEVRTLRRKAEAAIDGLITLLDDLDGDPTWETSARATTPARPRSMGCVDD